MEGRKEERGEKGKDQVNQVKAYEWVIQKYI
jgi:hypothetical protein